MYPIGEWWYCLGRAKKKQQRPILVALLFGIVIALLIFEYSQSNNDGLYLISATDDVQPQQQDKTLTFVLLVGYSESASFWLRHILSYAQEIFYLSEPLKFTLVDGYYKKNLVCFHNNTFRRPKLQTEQHEFVMTTFYQLFTCQFSKLHLRSLDSIVQTILKVYAKRVRFMHCGNERSRKSAECIEELEKLCLSKTHRCAMTTHLSMEIVNDMLKIFPNLKVIHLVQDPRAVIYSRLNAPGDTLLNNHVESYASDVCTRMYEDLQYANRSDKRYPNRLKVLSLEVLMDTPYPATGFLYEFLNMFFYTEKVWFFVYTNIQNMIKKDLHETLRLNLTKSMYPWETHLDIQTIGLIDQYCSHVYYTLDYISLNSASELRSKYMSSEKGKSFVKVNSSPTL